ncbi:major facilitator superfamily domain-containing protein [Scleroderma yunnanense]
MSIPQSSGSKNCCPSSRDSEIPPIPPTQYRLYKSRFSGLFGFVILGIVTGMQWSWFGPITTITADDFDISVTQVNWLGNIVACIFVPASIFIPVICSRYGIRRCTYVGGTTLLISAWVRYAGTVNSLSPQSAYTLLILGQVGYFFLIIAHFFAGLSQPVFQVLGPMYSEKWFDLNGRTTATMFIAIANPIGSALGQLLSPLVGTARQSILVLGIISTVAVPAVLLISDSPPSPPISQEAYMTPRERIDFAIITLIFAILVGATNTLSVLSAEWLQPVGYSSTTVGLLGATLLLAGIISAVISAPLFDRVFAHRIGLAIKILVPIISFAWLSLIWAVRPNNLAALFVIMVIIGMCSVTMLPIALELAVELTRNADGSSAILWCSGNLSGIVMVLAEGALRAPSTSNPPYNMHSALVLHGCIILVFDSLVFFLRAKQVRREIDEVMTRNSALLANAPPVSTLEGTIEHPGDVKEPIMGMAQSARRSKAEAGVHDDDTQDENLKTVVTVGGYDFLHDNDNVTLRNPLMFSARVADKAVTLKDQVMVDGHLPLIKV